MMHSQKISLNIKRRFLGLLLIGILVGAFIIMPFTIASSTNVQSNVDGVDITDLIIYQIITDRFYDGNSNNNDPIESPGLYDSTKSNWRFFWGGDWKGITEKMPYIANLGVNAIWISPGVMNMNEKLWNPSFNSYETAYHGYWGMDYFRSEPHFGTMDEFIEMVNTAHSYGIKIILDWVPNHSNFYGKGKDGLLCRDGVPLVTYSTDSDPTYYHHNGNISNWDDRYETQFKSMVALADFAVGSPPANTYLRDAVNVWLNKVDGLRIDAVKLIPHGWQKSYYDYILSQKNVIMFGEWFDVSGAPLWGDAVKLANRAGIPILNFDLNKSIRDVFMYGSSMRYLNETVYRNSAEFTYENHLPIFVNNHDIPRFLSINKDRRLFEMSIVASLVLPGVPIIYYGDEQYLYNDTNGGNDPYNRPMMETWDESTTAFTVIRKLAELRKNNAALRYGLYQERWINDDVLILERRFYDSIVLVAFNKGDKTYNISGLYTALPSGVYQDYLEGLLGGTSITVEKSAEGDNLVIPFTIPAKTVSVWNYASPEPSIPQIGSIYPVMGRAGVQVTISGRGFGRSGKVMFGTVQAPIISWSSNKIIVEVPASASHGDLDVVVVSNEQTSNSFKFQKLSGPQVPVTIKVKNAPLTQPGDEVYITGSIAELGNWSTDSNRAFGPFITHSGMYPDWFNVVNLPANTTIEFKFIIIRKDGTVQWEAGNNHTYTTPSDGETGYLEVFWQY